VQVHELQEEAITLESQTYGSSFGAKKYGSIKRIVTEAIKVYPWMDRKKVYTRIKVFKRRQAKQVPPDDVAASRVLQFSNIINQQHDEDHASRNKSGRPKGSAAIWLDSLRNTKCLGIFNYHGFHNPCSAGQLEF
jgi:hypothetical protein